MRNYELTCAAEDDVLRIWRYTAKEWGKQQADRYFGKIEECFETIAGGRARSKQPLATRPQLRSVLCEHHYVFFIEGQKPQIIAILHERMDFLERLRVRLVG